MTLSLCTNKLLNNNKKSSVSSIFNIQEIIRTGARFSIVKYWAIRQYVNYYESQMALLINSNYPEPRMNETGNPDEWSFTLGT